MKSTWLIPGVLAGALLLGWSSWPARAMEPIDDEPPPPQEPMDDEPMPPPDDELDDDGMPPGPPGMRPGMRRGMPPGPGMGRRMGPGMGPGGPGPQPPRALTQQEIDALLAFAREHFPIMSQRLETLKRDDPQGFKRMTRRIWPRLMMLKEVYERDPQGLGKLAVDEHRLEEQIREKIEAYHRERDDAAKQKDADEIRQLLGQQFDIRLQRRRMELADLQKRLGEQTRRVDAFAAKKAEVVERQFNRLTGEGDLDW